MAQIEAYGVKGTKSTPWRKTFKSIEAMLAWAEKHDAEIHGSRAVEDDLHEDYAGQRIDGPDDSELPQAARKMWS